jgi:hypothetical protein
LRRSDSDREPVQVYGRVKEWSLKGTAVQFIQGDRRTWLPLKLIQIGDNDLVTMPLWLARERKLLTLSESSPIPPAGH